MLERNLLGMCICVKYGIWNIALPDASQVRALREAGFSPLAAYALSGRGLSAAQAQALLDRNTPLFDPFLMKDMDRAVRTLREALARHARIAVFGDYDVDGITATCLLVDYLQSLGADVTFHIPGRLEEGYGLNESAVRMLAQQGVRLIVTVDCGITAVEEARLCRELGIRLVITDHHECKDELPEADAVVDPHRPDCGYPHRELSGVGVAFKLAAALEGEQERLALRYCTLVCMGTIADVMPLCGENRHLVTLGLSRMQSACRPGLHALLEAGGCTEQPVTATAVGYVLAPRINAAGRMEHAELAVQLLLSRDPKQAKQLAETLCELNRERQETELRIYREAVAQLHAMPPGEAIVLAGEEWHQGVVGIVASRLSEEFCRPTFLISLSGDRGKASSRSYGGFNLFAALRDNEALLEGYGGHELAAGFTIARDKIDEFREKMCDAVRAYTASGAQQSALHVDCELPAALLTNKNVDALAELEPCGAGCPRPVFCLRETTVESCGAVGNGRHLRLKLRSRDGHGFGAIFFSAGPLADVLTPGELLDVAFYAQINEFRGLRTVQLNLVDLRRVTGAELYGRFLDRAELLPCDGAALAPEREDVAAVWQYLLTAAPDGAVLRCRDEALCCRAAAFSHGRHSIRRTLACLDILAELGFVKLHREKNSIELRVVRDAPRNPLENSELYRRLRRLGRKE